LSAYIISNGVYGTANFSYICSCHRLALQRYNKEMEIRNDVQKKEKIILGLSYPYFGYE